MLFFKHHRDPIALVKRRQSQGQRLLLGAEDVDQRGPEVVPGRREGEDRDGADHGLGHRQHDQEEGPEGAGAVDAGGFHQLAGDREEVLAEQEDEEGCAAEHGGEDQRVIGVDQPQLAIQQELRDRERLLRELNQV